MHVFVDESERRPYLLGAVVVRPGDLAPLRRLMRSGRLPGERRIHFHDESPSRRRVLLSEFAASGRIHARVYRNEHKNSTIARESCVAALLSDLAVLGCQRLVFESRESRDRFDRQAIVRARYTLPELRTMTYEHMRPHEEPLLWAPDAVVWALGAGGEWKQRVAPLIDHVIDA